MGNFLTRVSFNHLNLKKLAAILLLVVFLFNIGGYYIVFWGMQHQARVKLLNRFDTMQYDRNELVVLSIPLNLPYPVETSEPERVDLKFDYDNETYRLVQRRFENDTIFLVCIRDLESTRISNNLTEYINLTQELPGSNKDAISLLSKLNKDFTKTFNIAFPILMGMPQILTPHVEPILTSSDLPVESPPPDLLS